MKWAGILNILCGALLMVPTVLFFVILWIFMMIAYALGHDVIGQTDFLIMIISTRITFFLFIFIPLFSIIVGAELCAKKPKMRDVRVGMIINILLKVVIIALIAWSNQPFTEIEWIEGPIFFIGLLVLSIILDIWVLREKKKKAKELG